MKVKRKYVFAEGGDTDYDAIYSALDDYKQSLQPTQQQDQPQPTDEQNQDETDQSSNYEDLLSKYQELEQRLNDYSQSAKTPEQDYGDSFLNFLFNSGEDNSPIDFSRIGGGGAVGAAGVPQSTGQFKSFDSPQAGRDALIHQLNLYQTGKTRNNVKPTSTLSEAMHVYAPSADKNDPDQYAKFIANRLGVTPDTPISQIDTTKWADAITQMEGNKSGNNPGNIRKQTGGYGKYKFAGTVGEQQEGLNNENYDSMYFPTQGVNTFRGLDSEQPVHIADSYGKQTILTHPSQTVKMVGPVKESRLK